MVNVDGYVFMFASTKHWSLNIVSYLVLTTSTGDATRVAVKPAVAAAEKWQGIPSSRSPLLRIISFTIS